MREYFSEPKSFGGQVKVQLNLFNYAIKADLKYTMRQNLLKLLI